MNALQSKSMVEALAFLAIAANMAASVQADSLFPGSSTDVSRNNSKLSLAVRG